MAFADEAIKPVVDSYMLARFAFQWLIPEASWAADTANVYSTTVPYSVASVTLNGVALTSGGYPLISGEFFYDRPGAVGPPNTLYVYDALGTPNDDPETNVVVVNYYQFASSGGDRRSTVDPLAAFSGDEDYVGRIESAGPFTQSWENAVFGVQTTSTSSISLFNADNWLQEHITSERNIIGAAVRVWQVLNETVAVAFNGRIDSYSISGRTAQITAAELTGLLNSPAYMGDAADEAYINESYALNEVTNPESIALPLKLICGRYGYSSFTKILSGGYYFYNLTDAEDAHCIHYSTTVSTSTNRKWILCRLPTSSFRTQVIGSVSAEYSAGGAADWFVHFSSHNLICGEWVKETNAGTDYFALVVEVVTVGLKLSPGLTAYNVRLKRYGGTFPSPAASTFTALNKPALVRKSGDGFYYSIHPDSITMTYTATSGGNYIAKATLANNFAAMDAEFGTAYPTSETTTTVLDPKIDRLFYLGIPSGSATHGTSAQRILEKSGLDVDTASITAADAALDVDAAFTIPFYGESEFATHREYLQALCASSVAYVRINQDGEAEYNLIDTPVTGEAIGDNEILQGSLAMAADGGDVRHTLVVSNVHMPTWEGTVGTDADLSAIDGPNASVIENDPEAEAFRPNATSETINHVLETMEERVAYALALRSTPAVNYTFSTALMHSAAALGDDVTIETDQIPGGSVDAKITALTRDGKLTSVTARELP